ncbi:MAG: pilus assembly protein TadG-related protein [Candidatus Dormibacteria bacterium]
MNRFRLRTRVRTEQGAIVVQAAAALLMLTVISALVVDYGIQLLSRNQAQNSVDAAALAAATALAFDGYVADPGNRTRVADVAQTIASRNRVAGSTASLAVDASVFCNPTPDDPLSTRSAQACVQVFAYRDAAHGNPIASLLGPLTHVNTLSVGARAIAQARVANATKCLRPIAIPDRWTESAPPWTPASTFVPAEGDVYDRPLIGTAGSGLALSIDFGAHITFSEGVLTTPAATIKPWRYLPIEIPGSVWGAGALRQNTVRCAGAKVLFEDSVDIAAGDLHSNALEIVDGLNELITVKDPDAVWNPATKRVDNSCADLAVSRCAPISPRILAVALYNAKALSDDSAGGLPTAISVKNVVGFFVESVSGTDITGYITTYPGLRDVSTGMLYDDSSFLRAPMLVQ